MIEFTLFHKIIWRLILFILILSLFLIRKSDWGCPQLINYSQLRASPFTLEIAPEGMEIDSDRVYQVDSNNPYFRYCLPLDGN